MSTYLISRGKVDDKTSLELIFKNSGFYLYAEPDSFKNIDNIKIFLEGYVIPRNPYFDKYSDFSQHRLIAELINFHGKDFINYIKGFFNLCIIYQNQIFIVNDIHNIKKFYFDSNNFQFFSNNLKEIVNIFKPKLNKNIAVHQSLFQHFINQTTIFESIKISTQANFYELSDNLNFTSYWNLNNIIKQNIHNKDFNSFNSIFKTTIDNYIKFFKPQKISSTLTGGRDTRSILSVLLHLKLKVHNFTFGYPDGTDVIVAKNICKQLNLDFSNHYIKDLSEDTYEILVNEIVNFNDPTINLHRAHRLHAIKSEKKYLGKNGALFIGAMGGDYIMGMSFNDYIITKFLRKYLTEINNDDLIKDSLNDSFVKSNNHTDKYILQELKKFKLERNKFNKKVEFNMVNNLIASTHDSQDINIFMKYAKYVFAPFMDLDVLEVLFKSKFSMIFNDRHTKNPFKRLSGGELQSNLIRSFYKPLANIEFSNQYTPNDILGNKLLYVLKRIFIQLTKNKSTPTFTYDLWFKNYIKRKLKVMDPEIKKLYEMELLNQNLKNFTHKKTEGYWHKFSNPIYLSEYYKKLNN